MRRTSRFAAIEINNKCSDLIAEKGIDWRARGEGVSGGVEGSED